MWKLGITLAHRQSVEQLMPALRQVDAVGHRNLRRATQLPAVVMLPGPGADLAAHNGVALAVWIGGPQACLVGPGIDDKQTAGAGLLALQVGAGILIGFLQVLVGWQGGQLGAAFRQSLFRPSYLLL